MEQIVFIVIFLAVAYFTGTFLEKKHEASLKEREQQYLKLPTVTVKNIEIDKDKIAESRLIYGNAVMSVDAFKTFKAMFRKLIGGNIKCYEAMIDRARREAVLRMKAQAPYSDIIINVRVDTANIEGKQGSGNESSGSGSIEALAYGTAITLKK